MTMHRVPPLLLGALLLAACSSGSSVKTVEFSDVDLTEITGRATRTIEHAPPLGAGTTLVIEVRFGDIEIVTKEGAKPLVKARMKIQGETDGHAQRALESYALVSERTPEGLLTRVAGEPISVIRADGLSTTLYATTDLEVLLPPGTPIIVRTESGDVKAVGSFGAATLLSKLGALSIDGAKGNLRVETESGDIRVRNVEAPTCMIVTEFGKIAAEGVFRVLEIRTKSGDVELLVSPGSQVLMPWRVDTAFGNMTVAIPPDLPLELVARSDFGTVESEIPATDGGTVARDSLTIRQGGGGNLIAVQTQSGEVRIKRR